jgi:precorrin-4 methylase
MFREQLAAVLHTATVVALALTAIAVACASAQSGQPARGRLYLVGMGTGDPNNMTLRAQKTVAAADVIFAMKGVQERYADLLKGKQIHDAGHGLFMKMARLHHKPPEEIETQENETRRIIREAVAAGKTVAVLDNGDPMIYGPHAGYLEEFANLSPEVVPGLSSFNAANAALKRDVTRGVASHSVILTAAMGSQEGYSGKDSLEKLAESQSTMVFFTMGMDLPAVVEKLKRSYPGDTPIAIVSQAGCRESENVLRATLDTVLAQTEGGKLPFEHLIYVGDFLR